MQSRWEKPFSSQRTCRKCIAKYVCRITTARRFRELWKKRLTFFNQVESLCSHSFSKKRNAGSMCAICFLLCTYRFCSRMFTALRPICNHSASLWHTDQILFIEVYLFFMYIRIYSHNLISAAFMIDEISICIRFEDNRKLANLTGMQLIIIRFADTHIVLKCSILQGLFKGPVCPSVWCWSPEAADRYPLCSPVP